MRCSRASGESAELGSGAWPSAGAGAVSLGFLLLGHTGSPVLWKIKHFVSQKKRCDSTVPGLCYSLHAGMVKKPLRCVYIAHGATDVGVSPGKAKQNYYYYFYFERSGLLSQ